MPKVHCLQLDTRWHDKPANHADVLKTLDRHPPALGSLIVLPEMFDVGFTMNTEVATGTGDADTAGFVSELARRTGCAVMAGFAGVNGGGRPANQSVTVDPEGRVIARYEKCHGFSPAGEHEKYAAGCGATVFEWTGLKVAPLVCYDLRFPELFRQGVKQGAELFVVIANWPAARIDHWVTLARARAIENLAYVVAVNRCGHDPHLAYPGQSLIVDPKGAVLARAADRPEVLACDIDPEVVRGWRRDFPPLRDARFM